MPYLSSLERRAMEQGLAQGIAKGRREELLEGIADDLNDRFGRSARKIIEQIKALEDTEKVRTLGKLIRKASSLDEVRDLLK